MNVLPISLLSSTSPQGSGIGHTAIHWCAAKGHMNCMNWLLQQGADINSLNAEDSTALHAAAANGQECVVRFLLDQPAMNGTPHSCQYHC